MAARSTGHWTITMGMVGVDTKEYTAAKKDEPNLVNMHRQCIEAGTASPLNMLKKCSACQEGPLPTADIVKTFRAEDGSIGIMTDAELKALASEKSNQMEVRAMVPLGKVDPVYLGKPNWLGPVDKSKAKNFFFFQRMLGDKALAAIVSYVDYGHDKVGLIRAAGAGLMLHELYYANEIREFEPAVPSSGFQFSDKEMEFGGRLFAEYTKDWSPEWFAETFIDQHDERVRAFAIARANGGAVPVAAAAPKAPSGDLMAALMASLEQRTPAPMHQPEAEIRPDVQPEERKPAAKAEGKDEKPKGRKTRAA